MTRLIFVNRYFHPDGSATSQMLSDLAFALGHRGMPVEIITSRLRYDRPGEVLLPFEQIEGVTVHRVRTSRFGRSRLVGRAIDYLTFYVMATWTLLRLARAGDTVVVKTDPPMMSVLAWPVVRLRRARLVNWLQDVFPEIAERVGVGGGGAMRALFRVLRWPRNLSLRRADINVVVGERMGEHLTALGVTASRIVHISNWADGAFIHPVEREANPLRAAWQLGDDFVVGYSGNLGRAHEAETLIAAIAATASRASGNARMTDVCPPVRWLFIGGGALIDGMRREIERRGLAGHVDFRPYVPREQLAQSLSAADVHLVSLRPDLEGLVVPSKFYGIAAAGRPAVFIGDADGEISRLLSRHACGRTTQQGDGEALARVILELAADPETCRRYGANARRAFEAGFDKAAGADRWQALLDALTAGKANVPGLSAQPGRADPSRG